MEKLVKENQEKINNLTRENAQMDVHFEYMKNEIQEIKKGVNDIKCTFDKFVLHADERYAPKKEYEQMKEQVDKNNKFIIQISAVIGAIVFIMQFLGEKILDIFR